VYNKKRKALDEVDYKLIAELQRNGRTSLVALGRKVGLCHSSVRERILAMIREDIIRVQANVNLRKIGYYAAFVGLEVVNTRAAVEALKKLESCPRVLLLGACSGDYNVFMILVAKEFDSLRAFIERNIRPLPGVRRVSISFGDIVWPQFVPYPLMIKESSCTPDCSNCDVFKELYTCEGCPLSSASTR